MAAEQPRHFRGRLQMALGIGFERLAAVLHGQAEADAGQHILQRPILGPGIEHIVDREQRHLRLTCGASEAYEAALVGARAVHRGAEPDAFWRVGTEGSEDVGQITLLWGFPAGEGDDIISAHIVIPAQAGIHIL